MFPNYVSDVKNGQLTAFFWYKDQAGNFDGITDTENTGYAAQKALIAGSRTLTLIGVAVNLDPFLFYFLFMFRGVDFGRYLRLLCFINSLFDLIETIQVYHCFCFDSS